MKTTDYLPDSITEYSNFIIFLQNQATIDLTIKYKGTKLIDKVLNNKSLEEIQEILAEIIDRTLQDAEIIIDFNTVDQDGDSLFAKIFAKHSVVQRDANAVAPNELAIQKTINQLLALSKSCTPRIYIDWNQTIDENGNSLMLALALLIPQYPHLYPIIYQFIDTKDSEGLPVFLVNRINNSKLKLIDIFKQLLDTKKEVDSEIFQKLRDSGSGEPKSPFMPIAVRLDLYSIQNSDNDYIIKRMQQELYSQYEVMSHADIARALDEIEQHAVIKSDNYGIISLFDGGLEFSIQPVLSKLDEFRRDTQLYTEHKNSWIFTKDLACIWQEIKLRGSEDLLIQRLAELGGCNWGQIVNLYQTLEKDIAPVYKPALQFDKLLHNSTFLNQVINQVFIELKQICSSSDTLKKIAISWYNEEMRSVMDHERSTHSELLHGISSQIFEEIVDSNDVDAEVISGNVKILYSQDYNAWHKLMSCIVAEYQYTETRNQNIFYQILTAEGAINGVDMWSQPVIAHTIESTNLTGDGLYFLTDEE